MSWWTFFFRRWRRKSRDTHSTRTPTRSDKPSTRSDEHSTAMRVSPPPKKILKIQGVEYICLEKAGTGAYGTVWKAKNRMNGSTVAIKELHDAFHNWSDTQSTYHEVVLLHAFRFHPNIVELRGLEVLPNTVYLVMNYMDTRLHTCIIQNILLPTHKQYIMHQLFCALRYLHSRHIIHRDIKSENILLSKDCHVKLCDFGTSCTIPTPSKILGTPLYRAPEDWFEATHCTGAVDIWASGIVLLELYRKRPLWGNDMRCIRDNVLKEATAIIGPPTESDRAALKNIGCQGPICLTGTARSLAVYQIFPAAEWNAADLLSKLLLWDPSKRLSADEALSHEYVRQFNPSMASESLPIQPISEADLLDDQYYSTNQYRKALQSIPAIKDGAEDRPFIFPLPPPRSDSESESESEYDTQTYSDWESESESE